MTRPELVQVDSIQWAAGANVIRFKTAALKSTPPKGTTRSDITSFSDASRLRLLTFINSIDRTNLEPARLWFVTLTYPRIWPDSPDTWKRHLQAFQKRLTRAYGPLPVIWKMEPQFRGAPHFHLIVIVPPSFCVGLEITGRKKRRERIVTQWRGGQLSAFRQWLSQAWYEIVGSGEEKHLRAGTNCEPLHSWNRIVSYAAKYLGKNCLFVTKDGETQSVGRFWGVWRRESFPIAWRSRLVPFAAWAKVRRMVRRYCKGQRVGHLAGRAQTTTAFVPAAVIERLIQWVEPIHTNLTREHGSVRAVMRILGFRGSLTDWYSIGEPERQSRHREQQTLDRLIFPPTAPALN